MSALFVYVTCADETEAQKIAKVIVEGHLAACANIMQPHQSVYWWEGKLEKAQEVAVIFKTRPQLFEHLSAAIKDMHSYDCPCIVALPIEMGNPEFLDWIKEQTTK